MRILFLAHRIPFPPNKGDKIRSFFILKHLSKNNEVFSAFLIDDPFDLQYVSELNKYCKNVAYARVHKQLVYLKMLLGLIFGQSLSLSYFWSRPLNNTIRKWLKEYQFDLIYVYSSGVAQYVMNPHAKDISKIMDFCDVDSDKWGQNARHAKFPLNVIYKIEAKRLSQYETRVAKWFNKSIFITERDRNLFLRMVGQDNTDIIPNGVNLAYFNKSVFVDKKAELKEKKFLVFTGAMDYFANEDAVLYFTSEIFPRITTKFPQIEFYIVGSNPTKKVQSLGRDSRIHVTGRVADIRPFLNDAAVYVAPLRISRGVQNKILEAMAFELPVITTSQVLEGITAVDGRDLLVCDNAISFAETVNRLLQDEQKRLQLGMSARRFVENNYSWEMAFNKIDKIIEVLKHEV